MGKDNRILNLFIHDQLTIHGREKDRQQAFLVPCGNSMEIHFESRLILSQKEHQRITIKSNGLAICATRQQKSFHDTVIYVRGIVFQLCERSPKSIIIILNT